MKCKNIAFNHMQIATEVSEITSHQYQGIPAKVIKKNCDDIYFFKTVWLISQKNYIC